MSKVYNPEGSSDPYEPGMTDMTPDKNGLVVVEYVDRIHEGVHVSMFKRAGEGTCKPGDKIVCIHNPEKVRLREDGTGKTWNEYRNIEYRDMRTKEKYPLLLEVRMVEGDIGWERVHFQIGSIRYGSVPVDLCYRLEPLER